MADFVIARPALHPIFRTSFSGGQLYFYHDLSERADEEIRDQATVYVARNIDPNIDDTASGTSIEIRERPSTLGSVFGSDVTSTPIIVLDLVPGSRIIYSYNTFRYTISSVVSCLPLIDGATTPAGCLAAYGARWNRSQKNFSATITVALEGAGGGGGAPPSIATCTDVGLFGLAEGNVLKVQANGTWSNDGISFNNPLSMLGYRAINATTVLPSPGNPGGNGTAPTVDTEYTVTYTQIADTYGSYPGYHLRLKPHGTVPVHALNDHSDVDHGATGGEMLHFSNSTNEWTHTPQIRVDDANGGDVLITTYGTGLLSVTSPGGNVLQTMAGNIVEVGSTSRQSNIRGTEVYVGVPSGAATNLIRQDGKAVATYAADARADVTGNPIPNMRAVRDEIAATAPTSHTLESHSNVQDVTVAGQLLVKNNVTDEWQGTGRITVDAANSDNVTVGLLAGGTLTVNTPSSNILTTNTGGSVSLGDAARACDVLGDEVTLTASSAISLSAPDSISLTTTLGAITLSAVSESVLLGVGTGATDVVRITEDATTYAAKIGAIAQGVPNVEFVNNQIALLAPVPALNDLTDVTVPTPNNLDILTYDDGTNSWIAAPPAPSTGVQWGLGGNAEGVFPGQDAIIDNSTGRLVLAQGGVEFLQARTSWNIVLGDVANFDAQSPPNFPVSFYGTGIRSVGLGDTTFDVTADYGVISFSHVNMANSTPISFNVGNGAGAVLQYNVLGVGRDDATTMSSKISSIGGNAIPNYQCIVDAIAAIPPPPTVPTVLNDLTDVETTALPNGQFLFFSEATQRWEATPRVTVNTAGSEEITIRKATGSTLEITTDDFGNIVRSIPSGQIQLGSSTTDLVATGTTTTYNSFGDNTVQAGENLNIFGGTGTVIINDTSNGNILTSAVNGTITVGTIARELLVNALESTYTVTGNMLTTAGGTLGVTAGTVVNITTGTGDPSDLILQLGKTAEDYATDCSTVQNAIPNVAFVRGSLTEKATLGGDTLTTPVVIGSTNTETVNIVHNGDPQLVISTTDIVLGATTPLRVVNVAGTNVNLTATDYSQINVAAGFDIRVTATDQQLTIGHIDTNTLPMNLVCGTPATSTISIANGAAGTAVDYASKIRAITGNDGGRTVPNRQYVDEGLDRSRAYFAMEGNITSSGGTQNQINWIQGTLTDVSLKDFTTTANNSYTYIGTETKFFDVQYSATPTAESNDRTVKIWCYKNPSAITDPLIAGRVLGSAGTCIVRTSILDTDMVSGSFGVELATNDVLRWYVSNTENASAVTIADFSVCIRRVN